MKMNVEMKLNLDIEGAKGKVLDANREAMRDTVVAVTNDSVKLSPWLTGNNRRSIAGEVSGMGVVASGGEGGDERMVDDSKIEGAVYGTSGYSGYLEVGHGKNPNPRPYFKPSLDMHFTQERFVERVKRHLK